MVRMIPTCPSLAALYLFSILWIPCITPTLLTHNKIQQFNNSYIIIFLRLLNCILNSKLQKKVYFDFT